MPDLELTKTNKDLASAMELIHEAEAKFASAVTSFQAEIEEHQVARAAELEAVETELAQQRSMLHEEAVALAHQKALCEEAVRRSAGRIRLNVGGHMFETSKPTLLAEPDSLFHALVNSGGFSPDAQTGDFFIDRDPKFFGTILNYLRDNRRDGNLNLDIVNLSPVDKQHLDRDIEYYQLGSLMHLLQQDALSDVEFVGFAVWEQNKQPHREQDELMKSAAEKSFPGTRPATRRQYLDNLIKGLPGHIIENALTFVGEDSDIQDKDNSKRGIPSRTKITGGQIQPSVLCRGVRCIICVKASSSARSRAAPRAA